MKQIPTGRKWGDKRPEEKITVVSQGSRVKILSKDFWEGPVEAGETGQYFRGFYFE